MGRRSVETPLADLDTLLDTLSEAMLDYLDRPFALLGDREGAVLAFELAHRLQARFGLCPIHLFVGAAPSPEAWECECSDSSGESVPRAMRRTATAEHDATATAIVEVDAARATDYLRDYHFQRRPPLDYAITALASRHAGAAMRSLVCLAAPRDGQRTCGTLTWRDGRLSGKCRARCTHRRGRCAAAGRVSAMPIPATQRGRCAYTTVSCIAAKVKRCSRARCKGPAVPT